MNKMQKGYWKNNKVFIYIGARQKFTKKFYLLNN